MSLNYLIVGIGGFLGANARYILGGWLASKWSTAFPFETLIINVSGSFVLCLFMTLALERFEIPIEYRQFFAIGFLGAYTTFSTLTFETIELLQQGRVLYALLNIVGSGVLGLLAGYLGVISGRAI